MVIGVKGDDQLQAMKEALNFLTNIAISKMFVPSKVETWSIIINTEKQSFFCLPIRFLSKMIQTVSMHHANRLEKLYIINPTNALYRSWKFFEAFIEVETREKVRFLKAGEFEELHNDIDLIRLEEKFGGQAKDLTEFWPLVNTHSEEYLKKTKMSSAGVDVQQPISKPDKKKEKRKKSSEKIVKEVIQPKPEPVYIEPVQKVNEINTIDTEDEVSRIRAMKDMTKKTGLMVKDFMTFKWIGKKGMCTGRIDKMNNLNNLEASDDLPQRGVPDIISQPTKAPTKEIKSNPIQIQAAPTNVSSQAQRKRCNIF